jgi:hypothetical protein
MKETYFTVEGLDLSVVKTDCNNNCKRREDLMCDLEDAVVEGGGYPHMTSIMGVCSQNIHEKCRLVVETLDY